MIRIGEYPSVFRGGNVVNKNLYWGVIKNFITNNQCIIISRPQKLSFGCPEYREAGKIDPRDVVYTKGAESEATSPCLGYCSIKRYITAKYMNYDAALPSASSVNTPLPNHCVTGFAFRDFRRLAEKNIPNCAGFSFGFKAQ